MREHLREQGVSGLELGQGGQDQASHTKIGVGGVKRALLVLVLSLFFSIGFKTPLRKKKAT